MAAQAQGLDLVKVVVRARYGAYFAAHVFLNVWRQILFPKDLHDDAL